MADNAVSISQIEMPIALDKKRTVNEEVREHVDSAKEQLPRKKSLPVKEPPKGNASISSFFKPKASNK